MFKLNHVQFCTKPVFQNYCSKYFNFFPKSGKNMKQKVQIQALKSNGVNIKSICYKIYLSNVKVAPICTGTFLLGYFPPLTQIQNNTHYHSLDVDWLAERYFLHINITIRIKNRNPLETTTEILMVLYKIIQVQRKLFTIWPSKYIRNERTGLKRVFFLNPA